MSNEAKKIPQLILDKSSHHLILENPLSSPILKEAARLSLCRSGEKITIVHDGDNGYSVTIPDPKFVRCDECLSYDHWEFKEVESYSKWDNNKFFFNCKNIYSDGIFEWECQGRLEMSDD